MEVSDQLHAPVALLPGKEPLVPIEWGWVGPRKMLCLSKFSYNEQNLWMFNVDMKSSSNISFSVHVFFSYVFCF
jgi:hypothetical protein